MDELLKKFGLTYEELNSMERETLNNWVQSMQTETLTIEKIREYVDAMRESVLIEVSDYKTGSKQDLFCKARLRNYTLLLGFLTTPDKARKAMERALEQMKK